MLCFITIVVAVMHIFGKKTRFKVFCLINARCFYHLLKSQLKIHTSHYKFKLWVVLLPHYSSYIHVI